MRIRVRICGISIYPIGIKIQQKRNPQRISAIHAIRRGEKESVCTRACCTQYAAQAAGIVVKRTRTAKEKMPVRRS